MNISLLMHLSPREHQVFNLWIRGYMRKEIASRLFIDIETVKTHIQNIYEKCKVNNRIDLILSYYELSNRSTGDDHPSLASCVKDFNDD